ncbi:MAG: KAP family P-loop NTPase fold protein [Acidobacteriota bacterium]
MSQAPDIKLSLWSDEPAQTDMLSFDAVAQTVADALLDDSLDPVALGLSGSWGSGKTTVLNLIAAELKRRTSSGQKVLVVQTDPWRYDPSTGAKESLISEVLAALGAEVAQSDTKTEKAQHLLLRLGKRIHWSKAIKLAATTSITLQIPSVDQLVDLVKPNDETEDDVRGLEAFREEFAQLINSDDLQHVRAVVVLVDDLDRCLPPTVVESLEAMRLFLAVPKMSFVIAADEDRVADAIRTQFKITGTPEEDSDRDEEDPAHLYLHKIVQTAIPLPALSHFDTQAYLLLLQMQATASQEQLATLIANCAEVRRQGGNVDDIAPVEGQSFVDELAFASRLTPLLYEKLRGNPRRIKRFLNDLHVRQSVATRRGIQLDPAVIAKLMTLEVLMEKEFRLMLDWLGKGMLRDQLTKLEVEAGRSAQPPDGQTATPAASDSGAKPSPNKKTAKTKDDPVSSGEFSQAMVRWAKLFPSLQGIDLSPYLTLAASFVGVTLIDDSLPERLRDIAANLLSEARAEQAAVRDADLDALGDGDAEDLLLHIGRAMRDQPTKQKAGVNAVLRIARRRPSLAETASEALLMLPPSELSAATPIQFRADDPQEVRKVLTSWKGKVPPGPVSRAIDNALTQRAAS